jgi:hypothetical protein
VSKKNEILKTEGGVFPDPRGNLLGVADKRRARAAAHQAHACPEVRPD